MVVVIGLGYAGRMATVRLRAAGLEVTAIDARAHATERTRLHEAAARGRDVEMPLGPWLQRIGAGWRHGRVVEVGPGRVLLEDGQELRCDAVVVTAGSEIDDHGVPGVWEHAHHVSTAESAARLYRALPTAGRVRVVGAGATGLELATEIAEAHPGLRVSLLGRGDAFSPRGAKALADALEALRIERIEGRVTRVSDGGLETDRGSLASDLTIWAGGMRAPAWLARSGLPTDGSGRVQADATLEVPGLDGVVVAGDCAATGLRMACASAMPTGCHAADTVIRRMRGERARPLSFAFVARCISLGRHRAVMQGVDAGDSPTWAISGRGAVLAKETILWSAARMHAFEAGTGLPLFGWRWEPREERLSTRGADA